MPATNVNPTRMELTRLKKKLVTARRGHKLLKDKRDELMRRFLELVKENKELRRKVEKGIAEANRGFALAEAVMGSEAVKTALLAPKQSVSVDASSKNVMSVNVPVFDYKTRTADKSDISRTATCQRRRISIRRYRRSRRCSPICSASRRWKSPAR